MKIKIPIGLASHYANHRSMIRVMATFCRLKSLESSSRIPQWRSQMDDLAAACYFSTRTLESRISEMKLLGLLKMEEKDLVLISWEKLWELTQINTKHKRYWYYDDDKINCKLEYIFQLLAIKETQRSMEKAYSTRVKNIPGYTGEVKQILGVDHDRPISRQEHLAGLLDAFKTGEYNSDDIYMLNAVNPDNQISCHRMIKLFGYSENSLSGPSYRKRILAKLGLVSIQKRSLESLVRTRKCIAGTVNYSRFRKTTFIRLCDEISLSI